MRALLMAAAVFLAAACAPVTSAPTSSTSALPGQSVEASACAARGGEIRRVGRMQSEQCVIKYADAGKPCTSGDQCAGDCRITASPFPSQGETAQGQCQAESQNFGCHASVENGKATAAICID